MNLNGQSAFNQARIEWAIRLRYSPIPKLDMDILASQLNAFRIGELRVVCKTWEIMMERDPELLVNSQKRKADVSSQDWQVVSDGSIDGDKHAEALQYFYDNLTCTRALDQDFTGGTNELIEQTMSAVDYHYSIHEMLLRIDNPAAKEVTAEFRHTPVWFFEARRGYLGYLRHIFDLYGVPCVSGEWLTACNDGLMRPLSLIFALKAFALRDWSIFNARYGGGFLEGITQATQGSTEWNQAQEAMLMLANDGAVLHNEQVNFKFLEQGQKNANPFHPMIEWCDSIYAKSYRGVDLATSSRSSGSGGSSGGSKNPIGASVQKEESGIFLLKDSKWITGVFNDRIDRPVIRYLFNQEPRAWFVSMPPVDEASQEDLVVLQALIPMGLKVALSEVYKRFRWKVPDDNDPCLTPVPTPVAPAGDHDTGLENEPVQTNVVPQKDSRPQEQDGKTQSAMTDDDSTIAAGADPKRNQDLLSPRNQVQGPARIMPDTQVDAGSFWSRQGLMPKGADGQTLPMPSLGYALPNSSKVATLEDLELRGMGQSRAARSLRTVTGNTLRTATGSNLQTAINKTSRAANGNGSDQGVAIANESATSTTRVAKQLRDSLHPVAMRLQKIMAIDDGDTQKAAIQKLLKDFPAIEDAIKADDSVAKVLQPVIVQNFVQGLIGKSKTP